MGQWPIIGSMMITIKTTPKFDNVAGKLMSDDALEDLFDFLEENPKAGDTISGTGGIRKLRWKTGKGTRGKSGGVRVLYHYSNDVLIILITLFGKSEKENISDKEKNQLKKLMPALIKKYYAEVKDDE